MHNLTLNLLIGVSGVSHAKFLTGPAMRIHSCFFHKALHSTDTYGNPSLNPGDIVVVHNYSPFPGIAGYGSSAGICRN